MSLVAEPGKAPVHMPKGGFCFDEEVATIFDDMAHRSIPNYGTVHRIHSDLIIPLYNKSHHMGEEFVVLDVGASTGKLFESICSSLHKNKTEKPDRFKGVAMDISEPMLNQLANKIPWVIRHEHSISKPFVFDDMCESVDIINMMYVLQFIPEEERMAAIQNCYDMLKPGGILLLAQKELMPPSAMDFMDHQYKKWRMQNGYTVEEIAAKTKALSESMWVEKQDTTMGRLSLVGFSEICETSRWMQFTSIMGIKPIIK